MSAVVVELNQNTQLKLQQLLYFMTPATTSRTTWRVSIALPVGQQRPINCVFPPPHMTGAWACHVRRPRGRWWLLSTLENCGKAMPGRFATRWRGSCLDKTLTTLAFQTKRKLSGMSLLFLLHRLFFL